MEKYYDSIKALCKKCNISSGKLNDEYIFTVWATNLVYFNNNIGAADIKSGFVDGKSDGGIDFVFCEDDRMSLIQGKSSSSISIDEIKNAFNKMIETITLFERKNYDKFSDNLKRAYMNAYDNLDESKDIELVLFTNSDLTEKMRSDFKDFVENSSANDYEVKLIGKNDLLALDARYEQGDLISNDKLIMTEANNFLKYGDNGIIVNIKASSLKELYTKRASEGLFSYNLREHISQKNVDSGIVKTIQNERENFWFYNNGITIGCNEFSVDGYKVNLYDFSIINGAQTTTQIGKTKLLDNNNDFAVICKIVKSPDKIDKDTDFISKISESSNSQKPIKPRDLKSNAVEQKRLSNESAKNSLPLSIEIKRGVKTRNYKSVDKWQRVTNELVGQLIYSCIFQKPGSARNAKKVLFDSTTIYKRVYYRKHDFNTLYDLVKLYNHFEIFASYFAEKTDDLDKITITKNGKLTILATTIFLLKVKKGIISTSTSSELHDDNLDGLLISQYKEDDIQEKLNNIFEFITKGLDFLYEGKKNELKITSYSNFFKTDSVYTDVILPYFQNLDTWDQEKMDSFMSVFE